MQNPHLQTLSLLLSGLVLMGKIHELEGRWLDLDIPEEHIPFFFHNNQQIREQCAVDESCPYKSAVTESKTKCWGYEDGCPVQPLLPDCPEEHKYWVHTKEEQRLQFWKTADFGYVKEQQDQLKDYCKPAQSGDSSLKCNDHLRFCRATNIFIDLSSAKLSSSTNQYREDIMGEGQIGGRCTVNKKALQSQLDHKSPLQSWAAELQHFTSLPFSPGDSAECDVVISRPTYIIKLDATVNMYHHFCDYVNLFISQHINNTFSKGANVLIWNTSGAKLSPMFVETWQAFSNDTPVLLNQYDGKKVCIKQAVFSLLARMRLGLYYNMPLMPGCYGSSMIRAFSHHLVHRLRIQQHGPLKRKIRVTLLERSTKYRRILNQEELLKALRTDSEFEVQKVDFHFRTFPFLKQVEVSHNSDIFIGMHGAGLTHMLFQPDWAVIFELYNCEDSGCYYDLARLRGIKYMTWEKKEKLIQEDEGHHPELGAHAKFTNYAFDVEEFMRLLRKAADSVRQHPSFLAAHQQKHPAEKEEIQRQARQSQVGTEGLTEPELKHDDL